jgi:hypothetical protein
MARGAGRLVSGDWPMAGGGGGVGGFFFPDGPRRSCIAWRAVETRERERPWESGRALVLLLLVVKSLKRAAQGTSV